MSAVLVIHNPTTGEIRRETVVVGSTVVIGADRYCVVKLEEGQTSPGWVSVSMLPPS